MLGLHYHFHGDELGAIGHHIKLSIHWLVLFPNLWQDNSLVPPPRKLEHLHSILQCRYRCNNSLFHNMHVIHTYILQSQQNRYKKFTFICIIQLLASDNKQAFNQSFIVRAVGLHIAILNNINQPNASGRPCTSGIVNTPTTSCPDSLRSLYTSAPNWLCPITATLIVSNTALNDHTKNYSVFTIKEHTI